PAAARPRRESDRGCRRRHPSGTAQVSTMRVHHGLVVLGIALTLAPREAPATQPGAPAFEMSARVLAQSEAAGSGARTVLPPLEEDSVRLAVLGDTGTGGTPQFQVGAQLVESRQRFPFEFVLL